ncbi:MAG: S41 family peptidase [Segetibacter sp.]
MALDSQYVISYVDTTWQEKQMIIKNYDPIKDTIKRPLIEPVAISKKQFRDYKVWSDRNMFTDTALSTAILSVNTFSEGKLKRFFRRSFREMETRNIKNLVLDLRQNSGGNILYST